MSRIMWTELYSNSGTRCRRFVLEDREWEQVAQPQFYTRFKISPPATTSTSSRVAAPCVEVHDMKSCTNVNQGNVVQSLYYTAQQPCLQACSDRDILPENSNYMLPPGKSFPTSQDPLPATYCATPPRFLGSF